MHLVSAPDSPPRAPLESVFVMKNRPKDPTGMVWFVCSMQYRRRATLHDTFALKLHVASVAEEVPAVPFPVFDVHPPQCDPVPAPVSDAPVHTSDADDVIGSPFSLRVMALSRLFLVSVRYSQPGHSVITVPAVFLMPYLGRVILDLGPTDPL